MPRALQAIVLLIFSNVFMTFAWYGHLRTLADRPWYLAALVSWGIALFEYLLQVPANRIGYGVMTLPQLKIAQEVITLLVFVPFAMRLHEAAHALGLRLGRDCASLPRCTSSSVPSRAGPGTQKGPHP